MSGKTGPGHPPVATRFRKGQSGNPKGRPIGTKTRPTPGSAFDIVMDRTFTVAGGGASRDLTVEEALQLQTYKDAIADSRPARREVLTMIAKRERAIAAAGAGKQQTKFELRTEAADPEDADAALLILGIAARNPERQGPGFDGEQLLLEPWAVQMALSRRRGGATLDKKDIDDIRRCTRDSGTLRWPRGTSG